MKVVIEKDKISFETGLANKFIKAVKAAAKEAKNAYIDKMYGSASDVIETEWEEVVHGDNFTMK